MKHQNTKYRFFFKQLICSLSMVLILVSCYHEETIHQDVNPTDALTSELDIYIDEHFTKEYNMAIRYRYESNFVKPGQLVAPPSLEVVRPMLDFVDTYWIGVYKEVKGGEVFFRRYVPKELVFLGGLIYNGDGTVTLGIADAGARITFTDVNSLDITNKAWVEQQLHTTYHEFAHIVHQNFKLPASFEKIAVGGYTGPGSWFNLTDEEALQRGFVTPYATSSPNEDFAETVAEFLFRPDFYEAFINIDTNCQDKVCVADNGGKKKIALKLASITDHYKSKTGLDLNEIRIVVQSKL